jgi:uncharacterized membrane protein YecN with MAPEG domain
MNLPLTILYGTLLIIVTLALALGTSLYRLRTGILLTTKEMPGSLYRMVRAHGNSAEWLAVCIFLLAFLELQGAKPQVINGAGALLVLARVGHSLNMLVKGRFGAFTAGTTYAVTIAMAIWALQLRLR